MKKNLYEILLHGVAMLAWFYILIVLAPEKFHGAHLRQALAAKPNHHEPGGAR